MEDNNRQRLFEVTKSETAGFEKMIDILMKKQDAISNLNTEEIQRLISEELSELNDIKALERERARILDSLSISGKQLDEPEVLEQKLGKEASRAFTELHTKFRATFARVKQLNDLCGVLLLHSLAFIKQNIRILTNDGKRKLVDKRA